MIDPRMFPHATIFILFVAVIDHFISARCLLLQRWDDGGGGGGGEVLALKKALVPKARDLENSLI